MEKQSEAPCEALWKTRFGLFWGRSSDREALQVALEYRVFDEVYLRGPTAIRPGDVVIDGGSHLGTFSRFALDRGARLIVAFEPDPICSDCFRKTFREEIAHGRIILIQEALWERPGRLTFHKGESSTGGTVLAGNHGDHGEGKPSGLIEVSATTLDEVTGRLNLERVDFVKLNVEGSEKQALAGARQTLLRFRPRILVNLEHRADDYVVIPQLIRRVVPVYQVRMRGHDQACFYVN